MNAPAIFPKPTTINTLLVKTGVQELHGRKTKAPAHELLPPLRLLLLLLLLLSCFALVIEKASPDQSSSPSSFLYSKAGTSRP